MQKLYHIFFYCPIDDTDKVKEAMFGAGAGQIGNYLRCSWQVLGEGQFEPKEGANPHIGKINNLEKLKEYRVEMVCKESCLKEVINAMKKAHPYEEVAYGVLELIDI